MVPPLSKMPMDFNVDPNAPRAPKHAPKGEPVNWLRVTSAATLVTSGALMLAGKHRLGLAAATTGTTLAMIDQQEMLKKWWSLLPGYIADVQRVLAQVEEAVDELAVQREKLGHVLGR